MNRREGVADYSFDPVVYSRRLNASLFLLQPYGLARQRSANLFHVLAIVTLVRRTGSDLFPKSRTK